MWLGSYKSAVRDYRLGMYLGVSSVLMRFVIITSIKLDCVPTIEHNPLSGSDFVKNQYVSGYI